MSNLASESLAESPGLSTQACAHEPILNGRVTEAAQINLVGGARETRLRGGLPIKSDGRTWPESSRVRENGPAFDGPPTLVI